MSEQKEQIDISLNRVLENIKESIERYVYGSSAKIESASIDENNVIRISINASKLLIDKHDIDAFERIAKRYGCKMSYSFTIRDNNLIVHLYFMREQKEFTLVFYKDIIDLEGWEWEKLYDHIATKFNIPWVRAVKIIEYFCHYNEIIKYLMDNSEHHDYALLNEA
ncbi:hypothetical protein [Candidatus Methanodesulfokora washburnensis]|uniref:Uncharacterized protein n=1 Tax=Candidatus Methanodesulfokora washburnensis TaxID=2478471 RepID=A0A429GGM0_9CREN|nr:hypothetical protein [Candidatus Methanodesulfokores washburnensis]RSN72978.1 hypothetical protein D6D85_11850 [Candidatus Methanodesulfokores washburnensis]